ncbi:unnamed protein product [Protopolystoma xenopodis]|uniref:Uncharacterized protein n=1 Tax=Protopolystoma xenopodis TaxID=117903 RepID=A0A448WLX9_9PLAT|nr:unnamed protein product [Protopolystoma xenopodis]
MLPQQNQRPVHARKLTINFMSAMLPVVLVAHKEDMIFKWADLSVPAKCLSSTQCSAFTPAILSSAPVWGGLIAIGKVPQARPRRDWRRIECSGWCEQALGTREKSRRC